MGKVYRLSGKLPDHLYGRFRGKHAVHERPLTGDTLDRP